MSIYVPCERLEYEVHGIQSFVTIGRDLDEEVSQFISKLEPHRIAVISDETVARLHGKSLEALLAKTVGSARVHWFSVTPGEQSKSLQTANDLLEALLPHMTRDSLIIAFGGGVVGNLAGTVASLLFRGSRFIHLPTTFMGQADSAIGIKQAVNASLAKNAFGAYHAPLGVFNDVRYLDTLPAAQWRNGLAESIKVAVARSPGFADELKQVLPRLPAFTDEERFALLEKTIYPKLSGLAQDPHERSTLLYLEIGHTIGHAIERASHGRVPHGHAIAMGMLLETQIAMRLGLSTSEVYDRLDQLFVLAGLPRIVPADVKTDSILQSLQRDNRRVAAGPMFVFATQLGRTKTETNVDLQLVRKVIDDSRPRVAA